MLEPADLNTVTGRNAVSEPQAGTRIDARELTAICARLDTLISAALERADRDHGAQYANDPYRGLHISREDVNRLLQQPYGHSALREPGACDPDNGHAGSSRLTQLAVRLGLDAFAIDVLLIALAPELDLRYERLYAYLQDDVTRKCPTVDLVLNLLCTRPEEKLIYRQHFLPDAPLLHQHLITLMPESHTVRSSLLARYVVLDERIVAWLLGDDGLPAELRGMATVGTPTVSLADLDFTAPTREALQLLARCGTTGDAAHAWHFQGPVGAGKHSAAEALAQAMQKQLLTIDLRCRSNAEEVNPVSATHWLRTARLADANLFVEGFEDLDPDHPQRQSLWRELVRQSSRFGCLVVLSTLEAVTGAAASGDSDWPAGCPTIIFQACDFTQRCAAWQRQLARVRTTLTSTDITWLASRYRFTPGRIAQIVRTGQEQSVRRRTDSESGTAGRVTADSGAQAALTIDNLIRVARAPVVQRPVAGVSRVESKQTWETLVLPTDQKAQLRELCAQVVNREWVYEQWGFAHRLSTGQGVNALFSGPPGTGKTMAAEVIAQVLQRDLFKIDLAQVVSKYIGETEKNLQRIFAQAEYDNAVLFFDEADALFGQRSAVRDAHDRYANIEVGYLLQKMEEYTGVAILATNLRQHLDDSFIRRLQFIIEFPFPDDEQRRGIWASCFPAQAPLAQDVDFGQLSREVCLAGGNIMNIAVAAACHARAHGGSINRAAILHAVGREFRKMGRVWQGPTESGAHVTAVAEETGR